MDFSRPEKVFRKPSSYAGLRADWAASDRTSASTI
jgi:hypothetical protein